MANLGQQLIGAVQALSSNEVSQVHFDKTVRATIIEVTDPSIGKYKVRYQNSVFYAYSPEAKTYVKNSQVYVVLPSKDLEKHPRIVDSVKKLGSNFIETIEPEDRMMKIGTNILNTNDTVRLLSYHTNSTTMNFATDREAIDTYKKNADYILIAAKFKTNLPAEQQVGGGDYGIKVKIKFYNDNFRSLEAAKEAETKIGKEGALPENEVFKYKEYVLKTASMRGQPYRFTVGSRQYAIFEIKGDNFIDIDGVTVYNKNFPVSKKIKKGYYNKDEDSFYDEQQKRMYPARDSLYFLDISSGKYYRWINTAEYFYTGYFKELADSEYDIEVSNFEFYFLDALTDEELQGVSLRVGTPKGSYFYSDGGSESMKPQPETGLELAADLRVRGKRVNYDQQKVNFYWFAKDARVGSDSTYYSPYGGTGWKCLNDYEFTSTDKPDDPFAPGEGNKQQTIFIPDTYSKTILYEENKDGKIIRNINEYENIFKCVAIFKNDNTSTSVSSVVSLYDKTKGTVEVNDVYIFSTSGTEFNFDGGTTTLKCLLREDSDQEKYDEKYNFYWCYSNDGGPESEPNPDNDESEEEVKGTSYKRKVVIGEDVRYFTTYSCTVYKKKETTGEDGELVGSASITLNNEENPSKYTLVLRNGVKTFKFTEEGISPTSNALDEYDRIDLPALTFDIYDNNGNLIEMSNTEKQYYCDITWVWPSLHTNEGDDKDYNPKSQTKDFDSMLLPTDLTGDFTLQELPDIYHDENIKRRWIVKNQAVLPYSLQNNYDIEKTNNTIFLEVDYQGQQLRAHTNFSFIKDGDLGTNGTRFITKLLPKEDNKYKQIIVYKYKDKDRGIIVIGFGGVKYNDQDNEIAFLGNEISILKGQIWDGGPSPFRAILIDQSNCKKEESITWSTLTQGRTINDNRFIIPSDPFKGIFKITSSTPVQNNVVQFEFTSSELAENVQKYNASYPLDYVDCTTELGNILIKGGYRTCNYANDGTRSGFSQQPFSLTSNSNIDSTQIEWENTWDGKIKTVELIKDKEGKEPPKPKESFKSLKGYNNVIIEPPIQYTGEKVNHYITCKYKNQVVAVISVIFYLNRYGLGGIQDWDGNSIKLNNEGSNYILAPQVGAGVRNTDGQFTGITIGKEFNNNNGTTEKNIGLLGYHNGERSILLDSRSGRAEFGKTELASYEDEKKITHYKASNNSSKIVMSPTNYGKAPKGSIFSANYYLWDDIDKETGNRIPSGKTTEGMLIDLTTPKIEFGSGSFSVTSDGHIHAKGGGDIAGWDINNTSIFKKNGSNTISINSNYKTVYNDEGDFVETNSIPGFKAGNFEIYGDGYIRNINGNFSVTPNGYIHAKGGGDIAGWSIDNGRFYKISENKGITRGVEIRSDNEAEVIKNNKSEGHKRFRVVYKDKDGYNDPFYVTSKGYLFSNHGNIAGWNINENSFSKNDISINANSTNYNVKDDSGTPGIKAGNFEIYKDGYIRNTNDTFSVSADGKITATSGTIGGWKINGTSIYSTNYNKDDKVKKGIVLKNNGTIIIYDKTGATRYKAINAGKDDEVYEVGGVKIKPNSLELKDENSSINSKTTTITDTGVNSDCYTGKSGKTTGSGKNKKYTEGVTGYMNPNSPSQLYGQEGDWKKVIAVGSVVNAKNTSQGGSGDIPIKILGLSKIKIGDKEFFAWKKHTDAEISCSTFTQKVLMPMTEAEKAEKKKKEN